MKHDFANASILKDEQVVFNIAVNNYWLAVYPVKLTHQTTGLHPTPAATNTDEMLEPDASIL